MRGLHYYRLSVNQIITAVLITASFFMVTEVDAGIKVKNFRGGDRVIKVGMSKFTTMENCGEPTRREVKANNKSVKGGVEEWYYNCGANKFSYLLIFKERNLQRIERLGYGEGESECLGGRVKRQKAVKVKSKKPAIIEPKDSITWNKRLERISIKTKRSKDDLMEEAMDYLEEKYIEKGE